MFSGGFRCTNDLQWHHLLYFSVSVYWISRFVVMTGLSEQPVLFLRAAAVWRPGAPVVLPLQPPPPVDLCREHSSVADFRNRREQLDLSCVRAPNITSWLLASLKVEQWNWAAAGGDTVSVYADAHTEGGTMVSPREAKGGTFKPPPAATKPPQSCKWSGYSHRNHSRSGPRLRKHSNGRENYGLWYFSRSLYYQGVLLQRILK